MRNSYTENEIILCTYAALYEGNDFGGADAIAGLTGRSKSSIQMKIGNIAAMLDDENIKRDNHVTPLTGTPPGEGARRTNWETVEPLTRLAKADLLARCRRIVGSH